MRFLLIMLLFTAYAEAAGLDFKMITLQHRFPQDLIPAVEQLVGSEGTVSAIDNHLVVRATPERMQAIEDMVARLDTARRNLRITISHDNNVQSTDSQVGVNGRGRIGNVEIGTIDGSQEHPGPRRQEGTGFNIDLNRSQNESSRSGQEFVSVMDGERAFIRVGQSVPYTQQWVLLTQRYIQLQQTTEFHDITTGFAVRPKFIGGQVELEVTPRIARLNERGFIDFEELSTVVRVAPGEWLDLGGVMQGRDQVSREILSQGQYSAGKSTQLRIRVD
ncbi:nodulation protein NolW [Methylobacillus gramineus]|uniref:secretin N-terminal domain-containing protein n=1 Tax=Methylobacillus gramineus TaxID=755169 RepID=UPI001CFF55FA|nr:secretin N-terminal domain-containing protein [Methylobacillus gramineus]MCB5184828.1 nodulation protein NolW [Methylobacillus gramineus]